MSYKPTACRCDERCRYCEDGARDAAAIKLHNQKVACHGERAYPPIGPRPVPMDWLEELLRG